MNARGIRVGMVLAAALCAAAWTSWGQTAYADGAFRCDRFVLSRDNSSVAPYATSVIFAPRAQALEIDFAAEAAGAAALAAETAGKGVWACPESFEVFLDVTGEGKSLLHLAVAVNGGCWDKRAPKAAAQDLDWQARTHAEQNRWTAKAVLPWSALGLKGMPATGARWRINIGRNFRDAAGAQVFSSFAATGKRYKVPALFADLYFGAPAEVEAARRAARATELAGLRKELAEAGLEKKFADKLAAFEQSGRAELVREIRDELVVVRALRGMK